MLVDTGWKAIVLTAHDVRVQVMEFLYTCLCLILPNSARSSASWAESMSRTVSWFYLLCWQSKPSAYGFWCSDSDEASRLWLSHTMLCKSRWTPVPWSEPWLGLAMSIMIYYMVNMIAILVRQDVLFQESVDLYIHWFRIWNSNKSERDSCVSLYARLHSRSAVPDSEAWVSTDDSGKEGAVVHRCFLTYGFLSTTISLESRNRLNSSPRTGNNLMSILP